MKYILSVPPALEKGFFSVENRDPSQWFVTSDPPGERVGSGGGTAYCLSECAKNDEEKDFRKWLSKEKKIIIHAAGHSRRLPAYAPVGKVLTPLPVFRWSRGQSINQKLIDLQADFLTSVSVKAGKNLNTLVASGDVLIYQDTPVPAIPDADIVCLGIWKEPAKCTNHGVFFMERNKRDELAMMLQKPSVDEIQKLIGSYDFLIDIGVWLFSDKAIELLMKKASWQHETNSYTKGTPSFYDMYTDFGKSIGTNPHVFDEEISKLNVKIVTLDEGEFYHFGTSAELIESTEILQNRVVNQREIWHRGVKPHSSIFTMNALTNCKFTSQHKNLWIENSFIPDTWKFQENSVITGIPQNQWHIQIPEGMCLDMVPVGDKDVALRAYGFQDVFKGLLLNRDTRWMGAPALDWFAARKIDPTTFVLEKDDIQFARIFPVLPKENITESFVQWLFDENVKSIKNREIYLNARKISASQIGEEVNFQRLYMQRRVYMLQNLTQLSDNHEKSVFHQLDLEEVANIFVSNNLSLPQELPAKTKLIKGISDYMFRSQVKKARGNKDWEKDEQMSFRLLKDAIIQSDKQLKNDPLLSIQPDQIVWGRSPIRIDLAGGWTDTPPYCMVNGGKVLNVALNLNGQPPIQCFIKPANDFSIILRSIDVGAEEKISSYEQVEDFNNVGSPFSITKAALALCGFSPAYSRQNYPTLQAQLEKLGHGLEITTLSMIPKGSGLGTSSILAATVLGTLSETCSLGWNKIEIGNKTILLEQLLTTGGGWQDQFGGILEGAKFLVSAPGFQQSPVVRWLPDTALTHPEIKPLLMLYYTGITRVAKNILAEIVRGMFLNSSKRLKILEEIGLHAQQFFDEMQKGNYSRLGEMTEHSWQLNQRLDAGTNTPEIQAVLDKINPFLAGKKLLGAGGGGFLFLVAKSLDDAKKVREILQHSPPNDKARIFSFDVSPEGLVVTKS